MCEEIPADGQIVEDVLLERERCLQMRLNRAPEVFACGHQDVWIVPRWFVTPMPLPSGIGLRRLLKLRNGKPHVIGGRESRDRDSPVSFGHSSERA